MEPTKVLPELNQQAAVIVAKTPLALAEHPAQRLQLSYHLPDQTNRGATVDLPTPDWRHLTAPTDLEDLQMCSDMFVYL